MPFGNFRVSVSQAAPGYGGMVRPMNVAVGDFPPSDIDFDDEDEI